MPTVAFATPNGQIDYAQGSSWIARPDLSDDPSRWNPPGFRRDKAGPVAIFYVPPTTYLGRDRWNAPLDDRPSNDRLRIFVASQASAFNGLGEMWAPRYRQATAGAFFTNKADAARSLDFAYGDVARAFAAFLAAIPADRPILLAGHSQGSLHLMTLLARRIAGTPIADRIVAAYLGGWAVSTTADLPRLGLSACAHPGQYGCIVAWQSFAEPADPGLVRNVYDASTGLTGSPRKGTPMLCVNPLTGASGTAAPAGANLGALVPQPGLGGADLVKGLVPARCDPSGLLLIGADPVGYGAYVLPGRNYHVFDYALFWANIRADAEARTTAFLMDRQPARRTAAR